MSKSAEFEQFVWAGRIASPSCCSMRKMKTRDKFDARF